MAPRKKTAPVATIELPALRIETIAIGVESDSALICHAWSHKAKQQMLSKQMRKATGAKAAKDPFRDFAESLYWLDEPHYSPPATLTEENWPAVAAKARFGFPSIGFKSAIVDAASYVSGVTKVSLRGAVHLAGEMVQIRGIPTIREDMVRIANEIADIRYRGAFQPWHASLTIQHNPDVVSSQQIAYLLNVAGFSVGLGDWRPAKSGSFGRFHATTTSEATV